MSAYHHGNLIPPPPSHLASGAQYLATKNIDRIIMVRSISSIYIPQVQELMRPFFPLIFRIQEMYCKMPTVRRQTVESTLDNTVQVQSLVNHLLRLRYLLLKKGDANGPRKPLRRLLLWRTCVKLTWFDPHRHTRVPLLSCDVTRAEAPKLSGVLVGRSNTLLAILRVHASTDGLLWWASDG